METIISCTKAREWTGKDGKAVPIYSIGLSDGRGGESFGKEIPVGTPVSDLTIEENGTYPLRIKLKATQSGGFGGGRPKSGNESFALAYAKDYAVAMIGQGKEFKGEHVITLADLFYNWMEGKKK